MNDFMDDPLSAVLRVESRLNNFIKELNTVFDAYTESFNRLKRERDKYFSFKENQADEKRNFYETVVLPLEVETSNFFLNVRYYALSALSLRRYVLGRMYIIMKTGFIKNPNSQVYKDFISAYEKILTIFETDIVPHLVDADI